MESKFDLFPCGHHGHRVTSYECQKYYGVGACPADCAKRAALVNVDWDISAPEIAWIFGARAPVMPVMVYDEVIDGLTPIGTPGRMGIYFKDRAGQVVRKCSDCRLIKSRGGFSPNANNQYGLTGICRECCRIRRQKGNKI